MSVGTAERAGPLPAPEATEPMTAGAAAPKDVEASPDPQPASQRAPVMEELATQFVFREKRSWSSHVAAGFLLVLPSAAEVVAGRDVTGGPGTRPLHPPFEAQ